MVKSPKIFLTDSGILHYFHQISSMEQLLAHPAAGHSWEGFVIQQIESILGNAADIYYYRTHNRAEIDAVIVKGTDPLAAIEIKLANSPKLSRGNTIGFDDLNAPANYIITPSSDDYPVREKTRVCSLKTFIDKYIWPMLRLHP